jgi:hypothetical protein
MSVFVKNKAASFDGSKRKRLRNGFLSVPAVIGRTGIYDYTRGELGMDGDPSAIVRALRVSNGALSAKDQIVVTNDHPAEIFVTADNARKYQAGMATDFAEIEQDGVKLQTANLVLTAADLIDAVESGAACECSTGETIVVNAEGGTTATGHQYDVIITPTDFNHVAIVPKGRAGYVARVANADTTGDLPSIDKKDMTMDLETLKGELAAVKAENEQLRKAAEADKVAVTNALPGLVQKRIAVLEKARKVNPAKDYSGMTDREIFVDVVNSANRGISIDGKSDGFVEGVFESITSTWVAPVKAVETQVTNSEQTKSVWSDLY